MLKRSVSWIGAVHYIKESTKLVLNFRSNEEGGDKRLLLWIDIILMDFDRDVEIFRTGGLIDSESSKSHKFIEDSLEFLESHYNLEVNLKGLAYNIFRVVMNYSWNNELEIEDLNNPLHLQEVECVTFQPHYEEEVLEEELIAKEIIEEIVEEEVIEREDEILSIMEPTLRQAMELVPLYKRKRFYEKLLPEEKIKGAVEIKFFLEVGPGGNTGWDKHLVLRMRRRVDPSSMLCEYDRVLVGYSRYPLKHHMATSDGDGIQRYIADCISEWYLKNQ